MKLSNQCEAKEGKELRRSIQYGQRRRPLHFSSFALFFSQREIEIVKFQLHVEYKKSIYTKYNYVGMSVMIVKEGVRVRF